MNTGYVHRCKVEGKVFSLNYDKPTGYVIIAKLSNNNAFEICRHNNQYWMLLL